MTKNTFKYGSEALGINIPKQSTLLEVNPPETTLDKEAFYNKLNSSLEIIPGTEVGIVVSDKTRLCGYELYLPWLTNNIESRGIASEDITFYIAYGTHPEQSDSESLKAYGETFSKYKFIHHNCKDRNLHINLGVTRRGTDVLIRRDILDHDTLILFGAISHHYFAGYGGGRKLIFPGLAFRDSIYQNHKLFIDFNNSQLDAGCQSGQLDGNPVAEDLEEIDRLIPDKLIISGILNTSGNVARFEFNNSYQEFRKTCIAYDSCYRVQDRKKFDLVIASSGGYPKDINFIQTHKSLHNAASFVKDDGILILIAECRDGIGNESFIDILSGPKDAIIKDLENNYSGNGGTALATIEKTARIRVHMKTSLSEKYCNTMGISKIDNKNIEEIINECKGEIGIITNASIIF